jgi:hypothetical protein
MKIGNAEFNVEVVSTMTRDQFINKFKGRIKYDINQAADLLDGFFKKEFCEEVKQSKPRRRRKSK